MTPDSEIDAERLAALIDGRVSPDERKVLLEKLAASEELSSLYADAVAASAADTSSAAVVRSHTRWRWNIGRVAAAAVVLVVAGTLIYRSRSNAESDPIAVHVAMLSDKRSGLPQDWDDRPWSVARGEGIALGAIARAVRFGALSVDLEVAVAAKDSAAVRLTRDIEALMGALPGSAPVVSVYQDIAARVAVGQFNVEDDLRRARRAATAMLDADLVSVGAWAEAGRLATSQGATSLRSQAFLELSDRLTRRNDLPADANEVLARLRASLPAQPRGDSAALTKDLGALLHALGS